MDAIFLTGSSIAGIASPAIMDFARSNRLPVGSLLLNHSAAAIVSLSASPLEQGEKAADKVMKIMDGVSPDKLRAETSQDIELIFNMKEAASLGCRIPMELVTEATRLIQ
jgi:putative ABC transport system substrate-binding protein